MQSVVHLLSTSSGEGVPRLQSSCILVVILWNVLIVLLCAGAGASAAAGGVVLPVPVPHGRASCGGHTAQYVVHRNAVPI